MMESVLSGVSTAVAVVGDVFSAMTSNPMLLVYLGAGLLGVGIVIFRRLKGAAR